MLQTRGSSPGELWSRRRRSGLREGSRRRVDRASGGPKQHVHLVTWSVCVCVCVCVFMCGQATESRWVIL